MEKTNVDFWGITDSILGQQHLQSYFLCFKNEKKVIQSLDSFFQNFKYLDNKDKIVAEYELGLNAHILDSGLKMGVFCPMEKIIKLEKSDHGDEELSSLRTSIFKYERKRKRVKNWKTFFSKKDRAKFEERFNTYISELCGSYTTIKYLNNPFIKIRFLKDPKNDIYQHFYSNLIENKYPEFDYNLITNHQNRIKQN